jgi:hypothetical protein
VKGVFTTYEPVQCVDTPPPAAIIRIDRRGHLIREGCDYTEVLEASRAWARESAHVPYVTTEICEGPCRLRKMADDMERRGAVEQRWRRAVEACGK